MVWCAIKVKLRRNTTGTQPFALLTTENPPFDEAQPAEIKGSGTLTRLLFLQ
jgi:hypothetical protein